MLLVLEFILIIILNKTNAYITQDSEIILLPAWNPTDAEEIPLTLKVFGKLIQLNLRKNDKFVSSMFEKWKYNAKSITKISQLKALDSCFYIHEDHVSSAAINFCHENGLKGFIFVENDTVEIRPLRSEFSPLCLIDDSSVKKEINLSFGKPHLIKTSVQYLDDSNLYFLNNLTRKRRNVQNTEKKLTIELAVFFDEAAYRTFMPLLDNDKEKIRCMILAYVNRIQAAFHHPSLGVTIDISLVHLDIMENQPSQLPVVDLDYLDLLHSFCNYAYIRNYPDEHSHHWDFSIYLTGIDLYKYENVKTLPTFRHAIIKRVKNYDVKGVAFEDACEGIGSCAVAEFRATSEIISMGLRSSFLATHEIGHLLGLDHDTDSKQKSGYKYVMYKYYKNENHMAWSEKSRNEIKGLWERKECLQNYKKPKSLSDAYLFDSFIRYDLPGREATAKAQCEVYLRDKNANVVTLHDICETLQCEVPHTNAYYFTGPALPGTYCALGMECRDEECVPVIEPPYNFRDCEDDNWSEWKEDSCKNSYCLEKSKGVREKRRFCKHQNDTTANCIGPYYDVVLCDASSLCSGKRKTVAEFAVTKCAKFTDIMSELELKRGWQLSHAVNKPWIACTIYCARKNFFTYFTPRKELLNFGIDPYFPDGTWCYKEGDQDYYCRFHHCLPENYSLVENWGKHYLRV
ncbi:A disintegrin and metalloproteinase with thrombospondin motifs adt-2-like isoform X1 [Linepithema humile]|uniref:A disintegrin and metalloproteinase with thrombospondin motifs adt-2-like isoform X1 n=2 Tax=Linepithema humile TaxID=83485 RepID=UPI00351DCFEE